MADVGRPPPSTTTATDTKVRKENLVSAPYDSGTLATILFCMVPKGYHFLRLRAN